MIVPRTIPLLGTWMLISVAGSLIAAQDNGRPLKPVILKGTASCIEMSLAENSFALMSLDVIPLTGSTKQCFAVSYFNDGHRGRTAAPSRIYDRREEKATAGDETVFIDRYTKIEYYYVDSHMRFGPGKKLCLQQKTGEFQDSSIKSLEGVDCRSARFENGNIYEVTSRFYLLGDIN